MLTEAQKKSLHSLLPAGGVFTDLASRLVYEIDAGAFSGQPDAVVLLTGREETSRLAVWAQENQVCLVARGAGTGLTGGAVAPRGGVIASFARLKSVLEIDELSRQAVVEPGVINQELQRQLAPSGLFYPPDPASYAVSTIGGNIAENAGGPHCLKNGVTGNYVLGLEVVLADGRSMQLGGKAPDLPEYDFVSLVTGSEGTLALVTQVVLGLRRPAVGVKTLTASFGDVTIAGEAVSAVIAAGLAPATIELMDHNMINIVEDYLGLGLLRQAAAFLIFDIEGYPEGLDSQLDALAEIVGIFSPLELKIARTDAERERLWLGRRNASGAVARISPSEYALDVCVPRSRLAEALGEINRIADCYGLSTTYLAHAGDGNLHPGLLCNLALEEDRERVHAASAEILRYCAHIGGSIGGEHGVGVEKREFMKEMYSPAELAAMLEVKKVFDPQGLLNPGKLFPDQIDRFEPAAAVKPSPDDEGFAPASPAEAAAGLRYLQENRQAAYIYGNGTRWSGSPEAGVQLSTRNLGGILKIARDDFYVVAQGGTTVAELQQSLAEERLWLAASSAHPESTIGGLIAANHNSPLRARYGALRDQLLAVQVALADGRLLRFGRPLVKDVAGYQMSKLFCGSYGSLGMITEVTLKILPQPPAQHIFTLSEITLNQALQLSYAALRVARLCAGLVLAPGSLEDPAAPGWSVWLTIEGHPADVTVERQVIQNLMASSGVRNVEKSQDFSATQVWNSRQARWTFQARAGVPPSTLPVLLSNPSLAEDKPDWIVDVANGLVVTGDQSGDSQRAAGLLAVLRQAAEKQAGYASMAAGPRCWLHELDAWGPPRPSYDLMRALKLRWDPADILNRGEFV